MNILRKVADLYLNSSIKGIILNGIFCFLPGLFFLALVAASFVTLRQGSKKGFILIFGSSIIAGLIYTLFYLVLSSGDLSKIDSSFIYVTFFYLLGYISIYVISVILKYTVSLKLTFHIFAGLTLLIVMTVANLEVVKNKVQVIVIQQTEQVIQALEKKQQEAAVDDLENADSLENTNLTLLEKLKEQNFNNYYAYFVQIFMLLYFCLNFLMLCLARQWQAMLFNSGGFTKEFIYLRPYKFVLVIAGIAILSAVLNSFGFIDLSLDSANINNTLLIGLQSLYVLSFVILFVSGLSFVHWVVNIFALHKIFLFILYLMLFLMYTALICVVLLMMISFLDAILDLRKLIIKYKG